MGSLCVCVCVWRVDGCSHGEGVERKGINMGEEWRGPQTSTKKYPSRKKGEMGRGDRKTWRVNFYIF